MGCSNITELSELSIDYLAMCGDTSYKQRVNKNLKISYAKVIHRWCRPIGYISTGEIPHLTVQKQSY